MLADELEEEVDCAPQRRFRRIVLTPAQPRHQPRKLRATRVSERACLEEGGGRMEGRKEGKAVCLLRDVWLGRIGSHASVLACAVMLCLTWTAVVVSLACPTPNPVSARHSLAHALDATLAFSLTRLNVSVLETSWGKNAGS
eukprot:639901-Rhodomonas_salina.1